MIRAKVARLDASETRHAARRLVNFGARVGSDLAGGSQDVLVVDLSTNGCKIHGGNLEPGAAVWLKLPDQEARRAHVIWSNDRESGCEFTIPFSEAELIVSRTPPPRSPTGRRTTFGSRV